MNVLLVEDNPPDARLVQEMFKDAAGDDVSVVVARTFAEAVAAVHREPFDAVLLDMGLPDGQGLDLVNRLRAETETPIVVLSGSGDEGLATMAVREGAQDYLVKGHVDEFLLMRALRYAIERAQEFKRMSALAFYDQLTGLQNRSSFMLSLEQVLGRARRGLHPVACLFIDLDGFKDVNDRYGHQAGDQVLVAVAQVLREAVRGSDLVCRLGGDEFVIVLTSIAAPNDGCVVAEKVLRAIAEPIPVDSGSAQVSASVGISFFPEHATDPDGLLHCADQAMYAAKHAGKDRYAVFEEDPEGVAT